MSTVTDAVPTELDTPEEGVLRVYMGDDKQNLECRYYEEQVSRRWKGKNNACTKISCSDNLNI